MLLPEVAVSALLLQDRVSNENGPDSGFYYWLCRSGCQINRVKSLQHMIGHLQILEMPDRCQ